MLKQHWLAIGCGYGLSLLSASVFAAEPVKTAKQCNSEMLANLTAIEAAGETLPKFFHDCWWNSTPGKPTVIAKGGLGTTRERESDRETASRHPVVPGPLHVAVRSPLHKHRVVRVSATWTSPSAARPPRARAAELAHRPYAGRQTDRAFAGPGRSSAHAKIAWSADPPGFSEARRIWVRQTEGMGGPAVLWPAVLVEPVRPGAMELGGLKCWMQPVLFERRRRERAWRWSLACDGRTAPWSPTEAPGVSFAGYASTRRPRVARRETSYD